ncbi:MAG TPA: radical SAM family heme chaperone HemW [Acidimicrobiales bacterium]|nr:radical SAM family heme chaperone HemW [Acidimicrobiales bacterium]
MTFGVYLHIPFCARRCDYCAFATWTDRDHLMAAYADAVRRDINAAVADGMPQATTVFFGGGTPSRLPADLLVGLLDAVPRVDDAEVTVECNPETVTADLLAAYRAAGVTRISLGVQSMVPSVLAALGREHDVASVARSVGLIGDAGFASFNLDLIFGAAGESLDDWRRSVDAVLALEPPHVSAYALTVEPGTPLALDPSRYPDDDDQADKYDVVDDALTAAGLENYEISNWARPGHECRHNLLYWTQGDYRGFGCAAHSHERGHRWWNVRTPERYIAAIDAGASAVAGEERLDHHERQREGMVLGLRTRGGVPAGAVNPGELPGLLAPIDGGKRVTLTRRGRLLANEVALRIP